MARSAKEHKRQKMYIKTVRIKNYKKFVDSNEVQLSKGFNVVVGKNNSGKTTFTEALGLHFEDDPFMSEDNLNKHSSVEITIGLKKDEFIEYVMEFERLTIKISAKDKGKRYERILNELKNDEDVVIKGHYLNCNLDYARILGYDEEEHSNETVEFSYDGNNWRPGSEKRGPIKESELTGSRILSRVRENIFYLKAERFNISRGDLGKSMALASDASNLSQVMHSLLTNNPPKFGELETLVKLIFKDVNNITSKLVARLIYELS